MLDENKNKIYNENKKEKKVSISKIKLPAIYKF